MTARIAAEAWLMLKDILKKGGSKLLFNQKKCSFIVDHSSVLTLSVPNISCGQSQMYVFGVACINDIALIESDYDGKQGFEDIDFLFKQLDHSCFKNKYVVIDILHYIALGASKISNSLIRSITTLCNSAKIDMAAEYQRFIYAAGCSNRAFVDDSASNAEPTPYAIDFCKKHFTFKSEDNEAKLASLVDFIVLRGTKYMRQLPTQVSNILSFVEDSTVIENTVVNSEVENKLLETIAVLCEFELVKRQLR